MPLKDFMNSNYGDNKASKQTELNSTMTIEKAPADELTNKLRGGLTSAD